MSAPAAGNQLVPGYILGPVIGKGGFATVYRAKQVSVGREVALKIDSRVADDERTTRRFLREATASSLISSHPHVVSLIDAGTTMDKRPYLVMELCSGGSVAKLVKEHGPMKPADVNELAIAVAGALAAAHEGGILHRDLKPANILIDAYGTPRLGDFGLAALPQPGEEMSVTLEALTPAFASPETFERAVPTPASDVWSFGGTLYSILTGSAPRRRADGSPMTVTEIIQHLHEPLPAPTHIPYAEPLMNVLWRATASSPDMRPTAAELRRQFISLRGHLGEGRDVVQGTDVTRIAPELAAGAGRGLTPSTVGGEPAGSRPRRWWPPIVVAVVIAALSIGAAFGIATDWFGLAPGTEEGDPPVIHEDVPWVAPAVGTCFGPLLQMEGGVGAETTACEEEHHWETFATGTLADDVASAEPADAKADQAFLDACTEAALEEYTDAALERITVDVLPPTPDRFDEGERRFSCIASTGVRVGSLER